MFGADCTGPTWDGGRPVLAQKECFWPVAVIPTGANTDKLPLKSHAAFTASLKKFFFFFIDGHLSVLGKK